VIERRAGGHDRGGGEDALPMGVDDSVVDVAREAEVIGVRDQVFQASILNPREEDGRSLTVAVLKSALLNRAPAAHPETTGSRKNTGRVAREQADIKRSRA
jgi:hypothetical protein